ncbi:phage baseplate assembly protein V [Bergeriella denitrificans]|uniref:Putative Gp45-like prophage protein n=1 Tax=Bergeriella denitrificans TaxID=494 RepID=A0A378UDU1_BERDE|nr:phage baseplate assembly protein V [Bergeriella denitrificans]STZ75574.1 putative Gp45-like prophage protein [Bergeriella denitrificans]
MSLSKLAKKTKAVAAGVGDAVRQAFRGKIALVSAGEPVQRVQLSALADETLQDVEHLQQFGFTSHPPEGTEAVIIPLGGATSHGVIVATEHGNYRVKGLAGGEVAVYDQSGSSITLKQGRLIKIDCDKLEIAAPGGVKIDAPNVQCTAQLTAQGQINGNGGMAVQGGSGAKFTGAIEHTGDFANKGKISNNGVDIGAGHKHSETNGAETGGVVG